jgi:pyruvate,water dikinase
MKSEKTFIRNLSELALDDLQEVGGKNASLGEMLRNLTHQNINVPRGYAVTVSAFNYFIEENKLENKINALINEIDLSDIISLRKKGSEIRKIISNGRFPIRLEKDILEAYYTLS